jgi:hypothetical protein
VVAHPAQLAEGAFEFRDYSSATLGRHVWAIPLCSQLSTQWMLCRHWMCTEDFTCEASKTLVDVAR